MGVREPVKDAAREAQMIHDKNKRYHPQNNVFAYSG
jgi:hypothetical protein